MIKIAFFGTGNFSKNILEKIINDYSADIKVSLIVSQPNKKSGRNYNTDDTPVKKLGNQFSIPVLQPEKLKNNEEFFNNLQNYDLDFIVVVAYGKIIPKNILEISKYGPINIHGSILPKYRGASPIQEALKNGDSQTGLTIMKMSEGMDEGDILKIENVDIEITDKTPDIFKKFEIIGAGLLVSTLNEITKGTIHGIKQNEEQATYCSKIEKEDGLINFNEFTAKEIYNKFRAYYEWPGIYSYYNSKKISFEDCFFKDDYGLTEKSGIIIKYEGEIGITCKSGLLIIKKVKLEGKKEMSIKDFINGNQSFLNYNFSS